MSSNRERCLGCGYYREELDEAGPCAGGNGSESHVLVEVDAEGMALPVDRASDAPDIVDVPARLAELVSAATVLREASHPTDREDAASRLNAALDALPTLAARPDYDPILAKVEAMRRADPRGLGDLGWNAALSAVTIAVERMSTQKRSAARAMPDVIALLEERLGRYPVDVFPEPPPGEHGATVDACSARAIRFVLRSLIDDLK